MAGTLEMDRVSNGNLSFDVGSLAGDPNFNFISKLSNVPDDNLFNFISADEEISPYDINNIDCKYAAVSDCVQNNNLNLSVLSINIQSLNSKFPDLKDLVFELSSKNSAPDIICLQEIWQFPNGSDFNIPGYNDLIYKTQSDGVQGGGCRHLH